MPEHAGPSEPPVRLIASDLDGTVLGHDFRFRPRTVAAITAARDAGIQVVFVTGRPSRWLHPLHEQLDDVGVVICSNGAVIYDPGTERILEASVFDVGDALPVVEDITRACPGSLFAAETLDTVHTDLGWSRTDRMEIEGITEAPLTESLTPGTEVVKLLAKLDDADPAAYFERVREIVGDRLSVTHSVAAAPLVEMGQRGLTKARTLERFAAELGISSAEVMAFGDMPNDLEMLTWAGRGYAMADGHPGVVAAVPRTAPAFTEDGVAQVIEEYLASVSGDRARDGADDRTRDRADDRAPEGARRHDGEKETDRA
ncbi:MULTISPECIES: HAD family hydrolase [Kocuria]|uniref:HAD family hydrolase n=1 Tax=Kocuria TaxID=57493 RepID=UPI000AC137A6|nr:MULTISPECIES: HAD family hydrolase [Kocuria]MDN5631483.1 Cof-type HAD-IIB family hydrolase [Kocuria sp.]